MKYFDGIVFFLSPKFLMSLVLDLGSFSIKAGLSTDEVPHEIRSVVGRSRIDPEKKPFIGNSAVALGDSVVVSHPISEGMLDDFSDVELLIDFIISLTKAEGLPVVVAEPSFNSDPKREELTELMFERFAVPELNTTMQGILTLVGTGRVTGLVLDCGHGSCQTVPVFESYVLPHSISSLRLGGRDLDVLLAKLIALQGPSLSRTGDGETIRKIKEKMCFCRQTLDVSETVENQQYRLPDGTDVSLAEERFIVPESYFSPSLVGAEGNGLAELVADCVKNSPIDLTRPLVSNIILAGGSSMFEGFAQRLTAEVKNRVSAKMSREVKIVANQDRHLSTWNGGKAFAELRDSFAERWLTREHYDEYGAHHIHSKAMYMKS
jgi:centractin